MRRTSAALVSALAVYGCSAAPPHAPRPAAPTATTTTPTPTPTQPTATPAPAPAAPVREEIARRVILRLAKAGKAATYDAAANEVVLADQIHIALGNLVAECATLDAARCDELIERWVDSTVHPPTLPARYADAAAQLLPVVRSGVLLDAPVFDAEARGDADAGKLRIASRPLAGALRTALAYDGPTTILLVSDDRLAAWKVAWDDALAHALDNLRAISGTPFASPRAGLFVSPWHDGYDASRALLPELIGRLAVTGHPVALIPNRDTLIITGDGDADGLLAAAELAEAATSAPRPMDLQALCWRDAVWRACVPDVTPAVEARYRAMRASSLAPIYADQQQLLEAAHARRGEPVYVAPFAPVELPTHETIAVTALVKGQVAELPEADRIGFVDPGLPADRQLIAIVPWARAREIAGAHWTRVGISPERWRVDAFPTAAEQTALRAADTR